MIISGGGPLIPVGIFRPKFAVPVLSNRFSTLIKEFGKGIKMVRATPIDWLGLLGKCFIFLEYSHGPPTARFGMMANIFKSYVDRVTMQETQLLASCSNRRRELVSCARSRSNTFASLNNIRNLTCS